MTEQEQLEWLRGWYGWCKDYMKEDLPHEYQAGWEAAAECNERLLLPGRPQMHEGHDVLANLLETGTL